MTSILWKKFGRSVIVVEVAGLAGAYWVWNELKTNPEAREKMSARAPFVMEAFNKVSLRACVCPAAGKPFEGNYAEWLEKKAETIRQEKKSDSRLQQTLQNELEWVHGAHTSHCARTPHCVHLSG